MDTEYELLKENRFLMLASLLDELEDRNPNAGLIFDWAIYDVGPSSRVYRMKLRSSGEDNVNDDDWTVV